MRVLHCIPSIWSGNGGPTRALMGMCQATRLAAPDIQIDIASTEYGLTEEWFRTFRSNLPEEVGVYVFRQFGVATSNFSLGMLRWVWQHCAEYDVLHIHALLHPISTGCSWIAQWRKCPYVLRPHGTLSPYTFSHRNRLLKKFYYWLFDSRTIAGASFLHFTAKLEYEIAARLGFSTPGAVIPIPYIRIMRPPKGRREGARLLFLSRLDPKKGLDVLLPAFARVLQECPDARLVVAGSGKRAYEAALRRKSEALGFSESVEFTGFVEGERKEKLLREAAVFVLPSYQENFGLALVEAMSVGLPVVTTRLVDLWPDIEDYGAGVIVDPEEGPLAAAIISLLKDEQMRMKMGENGMRLTGTFSHEAVGPRLVRLYRDMVAG